ncbi:hypothetical protein DPX39_030048100 [Trypanosoma brucei equiperdum]|uniref:Uncharacterized protein n=1 Tax=Trypanosoma brucei equiperdum TaxID=630700 RepID=A0A3L6LB32_9TRYP|nr:hypothetical protein DPX39_030048100 [Trypanosoma brucei equiperdum]
MEIPGVFSDIPRWEYSSPIYGNPQPLVAAMPTAQAAPFALLQQQMAVWPPAAAPAAVALLPSAHIGSTSELITPLSATFPQCVMLVSPTQGTFDTSFPETVMAREFTTPPVQPVYGVVPTGDNFGAVSREFSAFLRGEHCSYSTGQCSPSGNVISKGDRVVSVRNFSCILGSSHEKDVVGDTAIPPLAQTRPRPCHIPRHLLSSATSNSCFTTKTAMVGMASAC